MAETKTEGFSRALNSVMADRAVERLTRLVERRFSLPQPIRCWKKRIELARTMDNGDPDDGPCRAPAPNARALDAVFRDVVSDSEKTRTSFGRDNESRRAHTVEALFPRPLQTAYVG